MFYIIDNAFFGPILAHYLQAPSHHIGPAFETKERALEYAEAKGIQIGPRLQKVNLQ